MSGLRTIAVTQPCPGHRADAVRALTSLGDDELAYKAFEAGIKDQYRTNRFTAIGCIERRATKRSVDALSSLLSDTDQSIRSAAVCAIGRIGLWDSIPLLLAALADDYSGVRHTAAIFLNRITGEEKQHMRALKPDKAKGLQAEWQAWWEANRDKRPSALTQGEPKQDAKAKP